MIIHRSMIARTGGIILISCCLAALPAGAVQVALAADDLIQFTEQSFIQNVFSNQRSYVAARQHCQQALKVHIDFIDNAVALNEAQRDQLELAGLGDIHRFFTEYERVKRGMTFGGIPRDEWQAVWQRTQPLAARYAAGLHGPKSLFSKTIASALDADQQARYEVIKKERDVAIYIDHIRMTLSMIDRKIPLTETQRDSVIDLLVKHTAPPVFYGQSTLHFYVVLGQMANLPANELKPIFTETEWPIVDGMLRQARAMEATLRLQREAINQ